MKTLCLLAGGVYCDQSVATITACTFIDNTATAGGGGVFWHRTSSGTSDMIPALSDITNLNNTAMYGPDVASPPSQLELRPGYATTQTSGQVCYALLVFT